MEVRIQNLTRFHTCIEEVVPQVNYVRRRIGIKKSSKKKKAPLSKIRNK
jgi:hypothetical protein